MIFGAIGQFAIGDVPAAAAPLAGDNDKHAPFGAIGQFAIGQTDFGLGEGVESGVFSAAGSAAVAFTGASTYAAALAANGLGTLNGVAASTAVSALSSAGVGALSGVGGSTAAAVLTAAGSSTLQGQATGIFNALMSAAGISTAEFESILLPITSTYILHKPVDYALAGDQLIKDRYREWDVPAARRTERSTVSRSGARRLRGEAPGFTTKTGKRGYD